MIRYPEDVKAEMHNLAAEFCASAEAASLPEDSKVWAKAINDYVYKHCSDRTKAFLSDVRAIHEYADKHGLKV